MGLYISLLHWTDQGIRNVKDSPDRLIAFKAAAEKLGVAIKHAYYTVGAHDIVVVAEGADEAITAALLKLGTLGNIRTTSMRAYSPDEMKGILKKLA